MLTATPDALEPVLCISAINMGIGIIIIITIIIITGRMVEVGTG